MNAAPLTADHPARARAWPHRVSAVVRRIWPPLRSTRFWIVQATVLGVAAFHDLILVWLRQREGTLAVPGPVTSALLFIPVIYAALNFGVQGACCTAVLASVLIVPHWLLTSPLTSIHVWVETGNLIILNAVAVVVGIRVERERTARERAERALRAAEVATARYQSLFGGHPAAVVITDDAGTVTEVNAAAGRLFGSGTDRRDLPDLLGVTVTDLLAGIPLLRLTTADGQERLFTPSAQVISPEAGSRLVQVVLVDVTEARRRQQEQRLFGARLLAVQEEERARLARDLHDDPLQTLMFLTRGLDDLAGDSRLPADLAEQARTDADLATGVSGVLRKVIRGLRPPVLDDLGLVSALRQLTDEVAARSGTPAIELRITGTPVRLPPQTELTAYRVVQESLNNALRHSDARHVRIRVQFGERLTVSVNDDGHGIHRSDPRSVAADGESRGGLGLVGMRERVDAVGGRLDIRRRSPHGTTVRAVLPAVSRSVATQSPPDARPERPPS